MTALARLILLTGAATAGPALALAPVERPATVLRSVPAEYPSWARGTGMSTSVSLRVLVGRDGSVKQVRVRPYNVRHDIMTRAMRASFDSASVRAAWKWTFRPGTVSGHPAALWTEVDVPFTDPGAAADSALPPPPHLVQAATVQRRLVGAWMFTEGRGERAAHAPEPGFRPTIVFQPDSSFVIGAGGGTVRERGRFIVTTVDLPSGPVARLWRMWTWPAKGQRTERVAFDGPDTLRLWGDEEGASCDVLTRKTREMPR
jgi:hypothetical protein